MPLPPDPAERGSLYECRDCHRRVENPEGRRCACGGLLQNIGVPRPR